MVAAELGNVERMRSLLSATKQYQMTDDWLTQSDRKGRTPLHLASIWGYKDVVGFIVEEIIEEINDDVKKQHYLNFKDKKGRTPLFHAVAEDRLEVARILVEKGADLEASTNDNHIEPGSTPLMACAEKNNKQGFDFLLRSGADLEATRKDGSDAAYIACRYGHSGIIEMIAEKGKLDDIVNRPTFRGRTLMMTAALHGHGHLCKFLVEKHGASIDHQDNDKCTALIFASNMGHLELVKWMVVAGAKMTVRDSSGKTALKYADENGNEEVAKCLRAFQGVSAKENGNTNANLKTAVKTKSVVPSRKVENTKDHKISKLQPMKQQPMKKISR